MKKQGTWKLVVGIILCVSALSSFANGGEGGFITLVLGAALIGWWYLQNKEAEERAKAAAVKEDKIDFDDFDDFDDEPLTIEEFKVAGVTFNNDDGSSRQEILKNIVDNGGSADATFKEYEFNGKPAIAVYADGKCIGSIPRGSAKEVRSLIAKDLSAIISANKFVNEEGKEIYYAEVTFI